AAIATYCFPPAAGCSHRLYVQTHREDCDKSGNPLPAPSPRDCPTRTDSKAQIVIPPSMTSSVPTTKDETSDERYSTASAISSGAPIRFTSVWFCNHSFVWRLCSLEIPARPKIGVSTGPGLTA